MVEDDALCARFIGQALGALSDHPLVHVNRLSDLWRVLTPDVYAVWLDLSLLDSVAEKTIASIPRIRKAVPDATLIVASGWGELHREEALAAGADAYSGKTELGGFNQKSICELLTKAAMNALARGANANMILERVAHMLRSMASSAHGDPIGPE